MSNGNVLDTTVVIISEIKMLEGKSLTFCKGRSTKSHKDETVWLNLSMHSLFSYSLI